MKQLYNLKPNKSIIFAPLTGLKDNMGPITHSGHSATDEVADDFFSEAFEPGDSVIRFLLNYSKSLDIASTSQSIMGEVCAFVKN